MKKDTVSAPEEFVVTVRGLRYANASVKVNAKSMDEAFDIAARMADNGEIEFDESGVYPSNEFEFEIERENGKIFIPEEKTDIPDYLVDLLDNFFAVSQVGYTHGFNEEDVTYVKIKYEVNGKTATERHRIDVFKDWEEIQKDIMDYCTYVCGAAGVELKAIKDIDLDYDV